MSHLPFWFYVAAPTLVGLSVEAAVKLRQPWAVPALMVYGTTAIWYFADLFINPEAYSFLPSEILDLSYRQVLLFLAAFRSVVPWVVAKMMATGRPEEPVWLGRWFTPERLLLGVLALWLALLSFGTYRMQGDLFATLFPLDGRAGVSMWQRDAAQGAGATGFLVSTATYLYLLSSALFGVCFFLVRGVGWRILSAGFGLLALPYFVLSGTRSSFLAVLMPGLLAFFFFSRQQPWFKGAVFVAAIVVINFALQLIISFRSVGFRGMFVQEERQEMVDTMGGHEGLNMIQELCFENIALRVGAIQPDWGVRYLSELANVVPRPLWPNKPRIGIDYAIWRGFTDESGQSDIGVVATISTGFIGGGIMNFGPLLGPLAPAALMALWCGLLARWWSQRGSLLRACLFLAGLGITFNLGRDLTLLVAWPVVFGYLLTRLVEKLAGKLPARPRGPAAGNPKHRLQPVALRPAGSLTGAPIPGH